MAVKIQYTEGPEILKDVSFEVSTEVTNLIKHGVSDEDVASELDLSIKVVRELHSLYSKKLKRCCFCGDLFNSESSRRITCYRSEHYLPCVDCGTPLKVIESYANYMKAGGRRCPTCRGKQIGKTRRSKSPEEKKAIVNKQQNTMLERYGAKTALQVPEMKAQIQQTVKDKYGVDNLSQSPEIQATIRRNSREKYGVDHYSNAPQIRQHMTQGMIDKYGVANAQQCPELREKTKQTNLERYGCKNVFQNAEIRQRYVDNHIQKYGVAWPHQRPDLIEQVKQSNFDKYGAVMYPLSDEYLRNVISDPAKFDRYKAFMSDPEKFISINYTEKPSVAQICQDVGVSDTTVYDKLISIGKRDLATEFAYTMETELCEFIHQLDPLIVIEKHNRSILHGKEIDVYLPEYKIGFECNPTYTHNSSFKDPWGEEPKHYKYHAQKSLDANSAGIFLYHIFGYEWNHRRSLIQSQIRNLLNKNEFKIYARNTTIQEVDYNTSKYFLDCNHRQGFAQASVRLGLYTKQDNKLVSLMTFGRMRSGIGKKSDQAEDDWELVRFCNLTNTSVVGGASKLFKYFVDHYYPNTVVSFSDIAHTHGTLYTTLGFIQVNISDPGYVWVNLKDDTYLNRVSCQKSNLPSIFEDVTTETIKEYTEAEIMMQHGYARVFDSGVIRWEYYNNEK